MENNVEVLGLLATLLVVASFLFQSVVLIRVVNMLGAVLFVAYGLLIHSPSVAIVNTVVIVVQVFQLVKLGRKARNDNRMGLPPMIYK